MSTSTAAVVATDLTAIGISHAQLDKARRKLRTLANGYAGELQWMKEIAATGAQAPSGETLPPLWYFARDICRILQCEAQDPDKASDKRYWDRSIIDWGLIMTLFGQNLGVYWELTITADGTRPFLTNC